jgi:hypothetical protein
MYLRVFVCMYVCMCTHMHTHTRLHTQEMKKQGKFATGVPVLTLPNGKEYTQSLAQLRYGVGSNVNRV